MTDEAQARVACPTPTKHRYATLEAAQRDIHRLADARDRKLVAYDTCRCGWVHLASDRKLPAGVGSDPLTVDEIILLSRDDFNQLVRNEVRGTVHPDTAKALRDAKLYRPWIAALKLFQRDLNLQKESRSGNRSPGVIEWRQRIDRVVLSTSERVAEARTTASLAEDRRRLERGTLTDALRSDEEIDARVLKMMAGEIAADKLKRNHLSEFMRLLAAEYERFNIPLTKTMERALSWDPEETD